MNLGGNSLPRMPPVPTSDAPCPYLGCPLSLFPPARWRPARSQVLLLALARDRPDVHQVVSDLKRLDRADRFEIPQRLGQILLEFPELLGLAAAELVQILDTQRVRRGVRGIEAMQPQCQGLGSQLLALLPVNLRPAGRAEERCKLGIDLQDGAASVLVPVKLQQRPAVGPAILGEFDHRTGQPSKGQT